MPNVGDFHHVVIEVTDLDRSQQFYADTLGMEPIGRDHEGSTATLRTEEGHHVVLTRVPAVKKDQSGVHMNFTVSHDHWHAVSSRLAELGIKLRDFEHRDEQRAAGEISMSFWDPDGHRLQFAAYDPEAFQVPAAKKGKIVAGRIEDFPLGSVTHNKQGKFFVVRLADGFLALNQTCTHMQCNVAYQPEHYRFYCACHYRKFTRTGDQIEIKQDVPPLHVYAIEFVKGEVVVDTDRSIPRSRDVVDQMVAV
ncbi:MAG: hypothetical protein HW416_206 [Chloroflexi bacterium]|nr:hypothetical protein [Chloroflexota bacterium]